MARIRTIKPELFRHKDLFDLEVQTGLPIRFAWAGLLTVADREGRFKWQPEVIKLDVLPFDDVDMSKVLEALWSAGFIHRYEVGNKQFGRIPSFLEHQIINNRESASKLPAPSDGELIDFNRRVDDACPTREGLAQGEGKGKGKGKGRELEGKGNVSSDDASSAPESASKVESAKDLIALYCDLWRERYNAEKYPVVLPQHAKLVKTLRETAGHERAKVLITAYLSMPDSWFVTKNHDIPTLMQNLTNVSRFADTRRLITKSDIRDLEVSATNAETLKAIREGRV